MERWWEMDEILFPRTNATRHYDRSRNETAALTNVSCQIAANDRVAVVGPSGSGKSTLLHLLAGLDKPTDGVISWPALGPVTELRPDQICLVLQTPSLLPTLSVLENVELCWLLSKRDEADAESAALRILEKLDLSTVVDKLPAELSGGQMQRVAAARAVVWPPRLILAHQTTGQ